METKKSFEDFLRDKKELFDKGTGEEEAHLRMPRTKAEVEIMVERLKERAKADGVDLKHIDFDGARKGLFRQIEVESDPELLKSIFAVAMAFHNSLKEQKESGGELNPMTMMTFLTAMLCSLEKHGAIKILTKKNNKE